MKILSVEDQSLFEFNSETGEIDYLPTEEELGEITGEESVEHESGDLSSETGDPGSVLSGQEEALEDSLPVESSDSGVGSGDDILYSEPVLQALLASTPASGSLSSSTIDYFDRLVSGLPSDYVYVAYRNDSDDSYAGTIIYGDDYDVSGDSIVFGEGAKAVDVSRYSGSGYQNYISYDTSDATDTVVTVYDSGTVLYYTNAIDGYPVLGGYERPVGFSALLAVVLVSVFGSLVLNKLFNR